MTMEYTGKFVLDCWSLSVRFSRIDYVSKREKRWNVHSYIPSFSIRRRMCLLTRVYVACIAKSIESSRLVVPETCTFIYILYWIDWIVCHEYGDEWKSIDFHLEQKKQRERERKKTERLNKRNPNKNATNSIKSHRNAEMRAATSKAIMKLTEDYPKR